MSGLEAQQKLVLGGGFTDGGVRRPNWLAFPRRAWGVSAIINTVSYSGFVIALLFFARF